MTSTTESVTITHTSSTPSPTQEYSGSGDEDARNIDGCSTRGFDRTVKIFQTATKNVVDAAAAFSAYQKIAIAIHRLGRELILAKGTAVCGANAGLVPCKLLEMSHNSKACEMAQQLDELFTFISSSCSQKWSRRYRATLDKLHHASLPSDGSLCTDVITVDVFEFIQFSPEHTVELKMAKQDECFVHTAVGDDKTLKNVMNGVSKMIHANNIKFASKIIRRFETIFKPDFI